MTNKRRWGKDIKAETYLARLCRICVAPDKVWEPAVQLNAMDGLIVFLWEVNVCVLTSSLSR